MGSLKISCTSVLLTFKMGTFVWLLEPPALCHQKPTLGLNLIAQQRGTSSWVLPCFHGSLEATLLTGKVRPGSLGMGLGPLALPANTWTARRGALRGGLPSMGT